MIGEPHWFGPASSWFGLLHSPSPALRGAVVVCPPLGYEAVGSHRSLRRLAEHLTSIGIASLRVGYPGMSFGLPDEPGVDQVPVWSAIITGAAQELRSMGAPWVGVIGVRFAATLAADLASDAGFDAVVAWDPVVNGRRYARALKILAAHTDGEAATDEVTVAGVEFAPATLAAVGRQSFAVPAGTPTLVIQRTESSIDPPLDQQGVAVVQIAGTAAMLDVDAELSVVPQEVLDHIAGWLDEHAPPPADRGLSPATRSAVVQEADVPLRRDALRIGGSRLFAMTTRIDGTDPTRAVLFLNNGASMAIGPGGAWLDWADEVARLGALAVQMDFSGLGESPPAEGAGEQVVHTPMAARNVRDVVDYLRSHGIEHVTTIGLCSGALLALDAVVADSGVDHLVAINSRFDKPFTDARRHDRSAAGTNRFLAIPLSKAPLFPSFQKVPTWVWRLLARLHLVAAPTVALRRALLAGTRITLVFGTDEWGLRALERRDPAGWEAIRRHPRLATVVLAELDHSMFDPAGRAAVEDQMRRLVWPTLTSTPDTPHPSLGATS